MEFDESWSTKQCETLHVTIKTSLRLLMNACQTPFCECNHKFATSTHPTQSLGEHCAKKIEMHCTSLWSNHNGFIKALSTQC